MPRIFVQSILEQGVVELTGDNARYILRVLRAKKGDMLHIFDSQGKTCSASIIRVADKKVYVEVRECISEVKESPLRLILLQAILKGQKMDIVIQKAVELGVAELTPIITGRTEVKETRKHGRWQKIALEATRQSGRSIVPSVKEPVTLKEFFSLSGHLKGIVLYEKRGMSLMEAVGKISKSFDFKKDLVFALIGPEGGLRDDEVSIAEANGLYAVHLGKRILRAETATIAVIAILQTLMGDMGGSLQ
ncbi:MAG: 16S rRNA (uracil(1498)-N(3))-methyltransferase [Nitrospirae bacterium]|nr:16S rRNA (uracil(1498)-N(3))-methyltransferase [Nitrospirota bacterium]